MSLRELRLRRGLTQREAAEKFCLKYRTYQNYELGNTSPDMDTAAQFARYFGCTIGELFDLEEGEQIHLDGPERKLLGFFNELDPNGKRALMAAAKGLVQEFGKTGE